MGDVDRLLAAFADGRLVRPTAEQANLLDLAAAVADATGVTDVPRVNGRAHARAIGERLAGVEHLVLVLADGLGMHFVDALPPDSWLRTHLDRTLLAPFPPTTAVSLTSVATGRRVTEHAVTGWWTYLPERDLVVVPLPYHRLADETPLEDLGIPPAEVFPVPSLMPHMRLTPEMVLPRAIADSVYSRYLGGGSPHSGYDGLREAAERVAERIEAAEGPTYTYWYTPRVDTLAHDLGTGDEETVRAVRELDAQLAVLAERLAELPARTRLVVTADHGHRDVSADGYRMIDPDDPLLGFLRCHPSGDVRAVYFHLQPDASPRDHAAFCAVFRERFGDGWALLTTDELDDLHLMGPEPLGATTRARVGDYTALAMDAQVMRYAGVPGGERFLRQRSQHSGLSRAEMTVPLVIA